MNPINGTWRVYCNGFRAAPPTIRTEKGKKQRKLALNVTAKEKFPFLYQLLEGNVADVSTVQANMQRLLKVLQEQGWPVKAVLVANLAWLFVAYIV